MVWLFRAATDSERSDALGLHRAQLARVGTACESFVAAAVEARREAEGRLDHAVGGAMAMATYPVACARLMESCGLLALLSEGDDRDRHVGLLAEIVREEPGCWHPISDKFSVSLVVAAAALGAFGRRDEAALLLEQTAVWVADRHDGEGGVGLAGVDDDTEAEVERFLGWPFDFLNVVRESGSLVATAVVDMVAALGLVGLYADVVNDPKAVDVCPQCYQAPDTESQFFVEGRTSSRTRTSSWTTSSSDPRRSTTPITPAASPTATDSPLTSDSHPIWPSHCCCGTGGSWCSYAACYRG